MHQFDQPYHRLVVWQRADALVQACYKETRSFPTDERFGLTSQLRRASSSVALNIVEGQGRATTKDYVRFLMQARGSIAECAYLLELSMKLGYLEEEKYRILEEKRRETSYLLQRMIQSLQRG